MVVLCFCCCKLSSWNRKKVSEEPVTIRGRTKAQGLRQLSSFFAFLFFFLEHFPLKLYVSTDVFLLFSLFSFSLEKIVLFLVQPVSGFYRSLVLAVVPASHFSSVSLFSSFLLSLFVTYTIGSVIVLEPPQTWDGYISVLCVFSISPTVAIFSPHRLSVYRVPQPCWSSHLHHPAPRGLFRSPINHLCLAG